jgi:hypothetical protein
VGSARPSPSHSSGLRPASVGDQCLLAVREKPAPSRLAVSFGPRSTRRDNPDGERTSLALGRGGHDEECALSITRRYNDAF